MIIQRLKQQVDNYKQCTNGLFVRSALKEVLQDYVLNFVYNNKTYKDLIFTGGTCLRKVYGLPRLSEDLDFDYLETLTDWGKTAPAPALPADVIDKTQAKYFEAIERLTGEKLKA